MGVHELFDRSPRRYPSLPMDALHPPLRAVVFDLDGTLTDSAAGICATVATVVSEAGHPAPDVDAVRAMIGLPLEAVLAHCAPSAEPAALATLVERYKRVYAATVIPRTFLFPFTWSLLRRCRAEGLLIGLATAKSTSTARAVLARDRDAGPADLERPGPGVAQGRPAERDHFTSVTVVPCPGLLSIWKSSTRRRAPGSPSPSPVPLV